MDDITYLVFQLKQTLSVNDHAKLDQLLKIYSIGNAQNKSIIVNKLNEMARLHNVRIAVDNGDYHADISERSEGKECICNSWQTDPRSAKQQNCPQCATHIPAEARVCPYCQFAVLKFNQNKAGAKKTEMRRCAAYEKTYFRQLYKDEKSKRGCFGVVLIGAGALITFIPFVGWLLGPAIILLGLIFIYSPVWGAMVIERLFVSDLWREKKAIALARAQNTYDYIECPNCLAVLVSYVTHNTMFWADEFGTIECPKCHKESSRFKDVLLFVPYPEVSLTDSLQEYIEGAALRGQALQSP